MSTLDDRTISVDIFLSAPPLSQAGFGTALLASPNLEAGWGAVGDVKTYSSAADAADDTSLTGWPRTAALAAFAQSGPKPSQIKLARVTDLAGNFESDMDAARANDEDWYGLAMDVSAVVTDADVQTALLLGQTYADTHSKFYLAQGRLNTGAFATALAAAGGERAFPLYAHQTGTGPDDQAQGFAMLAKGLANNPDTRSAPWIMAVTGAIPDPDLTTGEKGNLESENCNYFDKGYGFSAISYPGVMASGRPAFVRVTADWYAARVKEGLAELMGNYIGSARKFPLSIDGQTAATNAIDAVGTAGLQAEHFETIEPAVALPITAADRTANRLRFTVSAKILGSATNIEFSAYLAEAA